MLFLRTSIRALVPVVAITLVLAACGDETTSSTTSTGQGGATTSTASSTSTGEGGASTVTSTATSTGTGTGGNGGGGGAMVCVPGEHQACYDGLPATKDVGQCKGGDQICAADGSGFGPCTGQVLPAASEDCASPVDDDCDGKVNEADAGCVCDPGAAVDCYTGPAGTQGVGLCVPGKKTCAPDGKSFGACVGEVVPTPETCATAGDDDCNGKTNDQGIGCLCAPGAIVSCYSGPPATSGVGICKSGMQMCNAQGTGFGACMGEVLPVPETCMTAVDDNCNGQVNEGGTGCVCAPNAAASCYTGPAGTQNIGICKAGTKVCDTQGTSYGACNGEVLPDVETCTTAVDDNCNGMVNESGTGCVCAPNSTASCYSGPAGTQGVGVCKAGSKTCNALGTAYGACGGEVVPAAMESCGTAADDNCNGQANEGCPAPTTYANDVKPILQAKCAPCHTTGGSGGANMAASYAATQLASYYCPGKTKGACTLVRIQEGSMPQGMGCSGNPAADAANAACLTAAQQATIGSWIAGGQLP